MTRIELLERIRTAGVPHADDGDPVVWPGHLFRTTLAVTAERIAGANDPRAALADFLDEFQLRPAHLRPAAVAAEPALTGLPEWDSVLAGVAEWLGGRHGFPTPAWTRDAHRFLPRMWFASPTPGFRAIALVETPVALSRRGVFIPERSLRRV